MKSETRYFEETQWLRDAQWIWYAGLASALSSLIPLLYVVYWQLVLGEPVGNTPMKDSNVIILLCAVVAMIVIFSCIVRAVRLNVYIDNTGVHYNFFPSTLGWKLIRKEAIIDYEVRQKKYFFEYFGTGFAKNRITKTCKMTLHGSQIVRFRLGNRWKIIIGTQQPYDFERALKRMINPDPII
jgi:hypothetical protein